MRRATPLRCARHSGSRLPSRGAGTARRCARCGLERLELLKYSKFTHYGFACHPCYMLGCRRSPRRLALYEGRGEPL